MLQLHTSAGLPAVPTAAMTAANTAPVENGMAGNNSRLPRRPDHMMLQREDGEFTENPSSVREVTDSSVKGLLARNLGYYVVASFLMGTQQAVQWEGILAAVGNDYLVIYQPDQDRYVSGDLYALKFVEFHENQNPCSGYRRRDAIGRW